MSSGGGDGSSSSPPTSDHEVADDFTSFVSSFFLRPSSSSLSWSFSSFTCLYISWLKLCSSPCSRHHVELDLLFSTVIPFLHHQLHPLNTNPARWSVSALALPLCNGCLWSRSLSEGLGRSCSLAAARWQWTCPCGLHGLVTYGNEMRRALRFDPLTARIKKACGAGHDPFSLKGFMRTSNEWKLPPTERHVRKIRCRSCI